MIKLIYNKTSFNEDNEDLEGQISYILCATFEEEQKYEDINLLFTPHNNSYYSFNCNAVTLIPLETPQTLKTASKGVSNSERWSFPFFIPLPC